MKPILYEFWRSSSAWRVRWALRIKGIDYQSVAVDLRAGEQRSPEHRARNPMGYVPALVIDGHTLAESVAIFEYLEETRPSPPLYPQGALARARVRQLVELVNSGVQPLQNLSVIERHSPDLDEQKAWMAHFNQRGMAAYEAVLAELTAGGLRPGPHAVGPDFTAADIYLVPQVASARRFGVDLSRYPRVLEVEAGALAHPHANACLPENQPDAPPRPTR